MAHSNHRPMSKPQHSGKATKPRRELKSEDIRDPEWGQKFSQRAEVSFRLNPRLALELAEVCVESGLTPSALVKDMVEKSLRIRFHVAPKGGQGEQAK